MTKLHGRRILHVMSPVRWRGPLYEHEKCSNYKVMAKTINWLPMCHHYMLVPANHTIPDDRENVTLIPFDYAGSVTLNRGHFNGREIPRVLNFREIDVDFIFNHQPELSYSILNAIQAKRYGGHVKLFNFFHWVDTPQTKPSDIFPDGFIRQLEGIHLSERSFFHCAETYRYLEKNFKKENVFTAINKNKVDEKTCYMPLGIDKLPEPEPFPLPKNKKIIVFNHRWNTTTGVDRLIEYAEGLSDEYLVWVTDDNAKKPKSGKAAPKHFHVESLPFRRYLYLLQKAHTSVCFVDTYMTWNLSVQDSIVMNRPSLVYQHPTQKYILGDDYPLYFKTKDEFHRALGNIPPEFTWKLPPHNDIFRQNLYDAMETTLSNTHIQQSKYNKAWLYHILQGNEYKRNILYNTHPDLPLSNVMEGLRLYCMDFGVQDDPTSKYTRLFIPNDEIHQKIITELNGESFGESKRDPKFSVNAKTDFWEWS
jgi:hypothetical protein